MKFLIDNQLPLQLAIHLRQFGHQCDHVLDLGLEEASDLDLWSRSSGAGQVMVSKDEDFVSLSLASASAP